MNKQTLLISVFMLLVSAYSASVEPEQEPDISQPPTAIEGEPATVIEGYTPDEAISEDNAIALPSDI
ncbi:hypothetical protein OAM26_01270 [Porticoccaceae bacterium]|nr:hypothetical protein [Porticoccaceae bacterium]